MTENIEKNDSQIDIVLNSDVNFVNPVASAELTRRSSQDTVEPILPASVEFTPLTLAAYEESTKPLRIDDAAIEKLTSAVVSQFLVEQTKLKKLLTDVGESQRVIIETLHQENAKYCECQVLREVAIVMDRAKIYHTKLLNIKKDMLSLHEKSSDLKKRALRIQQEKQKEALQREQKRESELEKERKLMAKMVKPT